MKKKRIDPLWLAMLIVAGSCAICAFVVRSPAVLVPCTAFVCFLFVLGIVGGIREH